MKVTKTELAHIICEYKAMKQSSEDTVDRLGQIISSAFSALSNQDPAAALEVLAQMNTFETQIMELLVKHEEIKKANKEALMNVLPSTLED